jgi:hypothetical protein
MVPIPVSRSNAVSSGTNPNTSLSKVLERRSWDQWDVYEEHEMDQKNAIYSIDVVPDLKQMNLSNPFDVPSEDLSLYIKYFAAKFILDQTNSSLKEN